MSDENKNETLDESRERSPKRRCLTRTGARCISELGQQSLTGRNWALTGVIRTKPGRGPPTLSLSCSDKIMKRVSLGLQGGLLSSIFPSPIPLSSVTVGGECEMGSLQRALLDRAPSIPSPPSLYIVPDTFPDSKTPSTPRPSPTSLLWCRGVGSWCAVKGRIQGATGKTSPAKTTLPVSRRSMYKRVCEVLGRHRKEGEEEERSFMSEYQQLRDCTPYAASKKSFTANFQGWTRKT
eukprot:sb/3469215/